MLLAQVDIKKVFAPAGLFTSVADLVGFIVKLLALGAGLFAFITFIYAAYLYVSSQGKPEQLDKAHKAVIQSLVGLLIIAAAYFVIQMLANFLGIPF
ncbi:hypothetical protein COU89_03335 [Candidatus Roizmanbacteria bacterium CG10_big_fil_rev_8_21_14_0_10_45_7]|uniref:Uncharacterized protein n=1 Tax=Candidatus Roizmanbacteria bacterium CG10_big_fil_rev_8_21_14_0_10_45_7 TaxID=1974854 RepID=A0A2M8KU88_9BACT|nr:MAG: hypothetical protein COU89_03335 [Candidatus Roizmanbacteria bacterium CG10_big_fil_rev_8_21_14_0_10_45_7]